MAIFDFIDDYRAEFWAFVIVFLIFGITAGLFEAGGFSAFVVAGLFGGAIAAFLLHIGKRILRR